ncbi:hypothetical protein CVT24_002233 [Panaeolus cyanescens]|uniref:Gti1/Pac2 family-domain-containing protein n=1 Tax=Panaeolus cyanescens TaxID=181874 RepID=A0A409YIL4_9AGAR|nr:hypothetical protein CVT24_002233 [Panaeolus cyanescens]
MYLAGQPPTLHPYRVQTPEEALIIFHAVHLGILRMVSRRLDADERRAIYPGCVYVWEERGQGTDNSVGLGIERWTDSIQWGPSRVRDEFLYYRERRSTITTTTTHEYDMMSDSSEGSPPAHRYSMHTRSYPYRPPLVKQTYSVFVETSTGRRKWHLIAYLTEEQHTHRDLYTIWSHPELSRIKIPEGMYQCARVSRKNLRQQPRDAFPVAPAPARALIQERPDTDMDVDMDECSQSCSCSPPMSNERALAPEPSKPSVGAHLPISNPATLIPAPTGKSKHRLAPLEFLKTVSPPKRHALDEMALIRLSFPSASF